MTKVHKIKPHRITYATAISPVHMPFNNCVWL